MTKRLCFRKHKLERALSPEIVSEDDNTPPSIGDLRWRDGRAIGEGAMIAYLEVSITDEEWNVVDVRADLTSFGLGEVELNDRGLDGDEAVGDDVYTTAVIIAGLQVGAMPVSCDGHGQFWGIDLDHGRT